MQSRHTWVFCLMLLRLTVRICVSVPHVLEQGSHFDQTSPFARISQTRVQDLQIDWTRILINLDHTNAFSKVFVFVAIKTKQAYFNSRWPHLITICNKILDMKYLASLPGCTVHCSHHIYSISTLVWESNKIEPKWRDYVITLPNDAALLTSMQELTGTFVSLLRWFIMETSYAPSVWQDCVP